MSVNPTNNMVPEASVNSACTLPRDLDPVNPGDRIFNAHPAQSVLPKCQVGLNLTQALFIGAKDMCSAFSCMCLERALFQFPQRLTIG
jgi:hypothetical protein